MVDVAGAVAPPEGSVDAGVAWHYGDPMREQRLLSEGAGFVDLSHRPVVQVIGRRPVARGCTRSRHSMSRRFRLGQWTQALVLSPNGHVEHHLTLVDDGERTLGARRAGYC